MNDERMEPPSFGECRFRLGVGFGVITSSTIALFEPMNAALVERIWSIADAYSDVEEILELLSSTGLRSLGSFAIVHHDGEGLRAMVRGSGAVVVQTPDGPVSVDGIDKRTWREAVIRVWHECQLHLDAGAGGFDFRVQRGLVPASAIAVGGKQLELVTESSLAGADQLAPAVLHDGHDQPIDVGEPSKRKGVKDGAEDVNRTIGPQQLERTEGPISARGDSEESQRPDTALGGDGEDDEYMALFGATVARSVQSAAVTEVVAEADDAAATIASPSRDTSIGRRESSFDPPRAVTTGRGLISGIPSAPLGSDSAGASSGDHDGRTMTKAQLEALRGGTTAQVPSLAQPAVGAGQVAVQARFCASQHANPVHIDTCRICGSHVVGVPTVVARPTLGVLRFSHGVVVPLERSLLIGRNPKVEGPLASEVPQLVKLDLGQGLSRTHAAIRLEGWQILVEDLSSANGTIVTLPGRQPRRLHSHEPFLVERGASIDFGGEVTCIVE